MARTDAAADPVEAADPFVETGTDGASGAPSGQTMGETLGAACHEPFREACADFDRHVSSTLLDALREGIEVHDAALVEAGLEGEVPEGWRDRADALLDYRHEIDSRILEPLAEHLEAAGPARALAERIREARSAAVEACAGLAEERTEPWTENALSPRPTDSLSRRLRKPVARVMSHARHPGRERSVPFRAVAERHLRSAVIPAVDEVTSEILTAWLEWTRRLEGVWIRWCDNTLPLFVRAEIPGVQDADQLWTAIREAGATLVEELMALVEEAPGAEALARRRIDALRGEVEDDLLVAGCMVFRPDRPEGPTAPLVRLERRAAPGEAWDEAVAQRLRLYLAVLGILAGATAVQRRLTLRFREACVRPLAELPSIAASIESVAAGLPEHRIDEAGLTSLDQPVDERLQPALAAVPPADQVEKTVQQGADSTVEALLSMVRQAPASFEVLDEQQRPPAGPRAPETRTVALQELARQAFDALRIERIRSSTLGLTQAVEAVRADLAELPDVFRFAYDEALREIESEEEESAERARGLVGEALKSMADSLRGQLRGLEEAVREGERRLAGEISAGSLALLDRVAAGRMQARLLAARSRIADLRAWINDTLRPRLARVAEKLGGWLSAWQRLLTRGLRKGTAIVGGPAETASASARTIRSLADADDYIGKLPLVYQRLFTLEPLAEPALLVGREAELADALARFRRWRSSDGVPLIVRGRPGSGITSYLNVLAATLGDHGTSTLRVALDQRLDDERRLAGLLSEPLGLGSLDSLDALAEAIFDAEPADLPGVVALDNLEHVYLRVPTGTNLTERLLTLMAETEPRLWWVGGVTSSAWQTISASEPTAVAQVDHLELRPLGPAETRAALTVRHRRSGLPVRFEEPASGRRVLRTRLRRIRDPQAYNDLLEADFFDRLNRSSSGHLPLALFKWLEAADFESGEGVSMRSPERPDFSLFESLTLTQNFTVKALLEHRTLSLAEHDRIFRLPRQESYQIFESLQNRNLIVALGGAKRGDPDRSEIAEGFRYRVHRLLTGALTAHLQARNIVH